MFMFQKGILVLLILISAIPAVLARWESCDWTSCVAPIQFNTFLLKYEPITCIQGQYEMEREFCNQYFMRIKCCHGKGSAKGKTDYDTTYYDDMDYDTGAEGFIDYKFPEKEKAYWMKWFQNE